MKKEIASDDFKGLIGYFSSEMLKKSEELAYLDSLTGDGDMGVTITLCMRAMTKTMTKIASEGDVSMSGLLMLLGENVGETAPSTFGTLFATMLKSMGEELGKTAAAAIDAGVFASMTEAAALGVMARGNAKPGDKTMLDALVPAAQAAHESAKAGDSLAICAEKAAQAARDGAENTIGMKAAVGRAGYMGERSAASRDPGAEAIALMAAALASFLQQ